MSGHCFSWICNIATVNFVLHLEAFQKLKKFFFFFIKKKISKSIFFSNIYFFQFCIIFFFFLFLSNFPSCTFYYLLIYLNFPTFSLQTTLTSLAPYYSRHHSLDIPPFSKIVLAWQENHYTVLYFTIYYCLLFIFLIKCF